MKIEPASARTLEAVIRADLAAVDRFEAALAGTDPTGDERSAVAAGYYLHNLYSALENSFDQISRSFENHIKDLSRWHAELLSKMLLDLSPIRPVVLPVEVRELVNDLRAFRHFFRHSYGMDLNPLKLADLRTRWLSGSGPVKAALGGFATALREVADRAD